MEDLYNTLNNLPDTYFEFVDSVMSYVKKKPERLTVLTVDMNSILPYAITPFVENHLHDLPS